MDYREVIQFQFTAWPDHGVPTYATATLSFLRRVQATNPEDAGTSSTLSKLTDLLILAER